jgi:hypothetical protein
MRSLSFPFYMQWLPLLVFAADGPSVRIYTRTVDEGEAHGLIVRQGRDRAPPVVVSREDAIAELGGFLSRYYLSDLAAAFPFMTADTVYQDHVRRLAAATRPRLR